MGRSSKFSFPIPGRKKHSQNPSENNVSLKPQEISPPSLPNLSKAERILGAGNLGNNSPIVGENASWKYPSSRSSSRITISISESTNDNDNWDNESDVLGKRSPRRLHGKASSTLLGQNYGDDNTSAGWRLRNEDSNSTLKSHYDRQKSPLSVSQQTSASSARDLALRKGFPPVAHRSPLLQAEAPYQDPYETQFKANEGLMTRGNDGEQYYEKESRKKPAKLDLSMLFPRPSRRNTGKSTDGSSMTPSASSMSTDGCHTPSSETSRRRLKKTRSKESMQSQGLSIRSSQSHDPQNRGMERGHNLHEHYEQTLRSPMTIPRLDQIPESRVPQRTTSRGKDEISRAAQYHQFPTPPQEDRMSAAPGGKSSFSWKNVRSSMISPKERAENIPPRKDTINLAQRNVGSSSSASIISKGSRRTNGSGSGAISNADLKLNSVLSLSSDSEDEPWAQEEIKTSSTRGDRKSSSTKDSRTQQSPPNGGLVPRHTPKKSDLGFPTQSNSYLSVPEKISTPTSSTQRSARREDPNYSATHQSNYRQPSQRDKDKKGHKKHPSISSARSGPSIKSALSGASLSPIPSPAPSQPTPPLSPASMNFRETSTEKTSRLMAVTQQEEALLSALRLKRTQIREKIITEHEHQVSLSPPRTKKTHHSEEQKRILLYLEPSHDDAAEPSPDLSDFLAFDSDEESTPRGSHSGKGRPDSYIVETSSRRYPTTSHSTARLSAVGTSGGLHHAESKRRNNNGVRFANDTKKAHPTTTRTTRANFLFD